jgi:hypothetical protein
MKFLLFFRKKDSVATWAAQDQAEKLLAEGLRFLGQFCGRMADLVDAQRLSRAGYTHQGEFLERTDRGGPRKQ